MRISIITGTRADWGIMSPLAAALRVNKDVELSIIATNMHLMEQFGMTVNEITDAGFIVAERVPVSCAGDSGVGTAHAMAQCLDGMADALQRVAPDAVIILGDRFEMLAAASAATVMRIPIIHIAGGTVSEGAVDDSIRHAITQLSSLHLVETDEHRRRVIRMGHHPSTVIATGALGVWNALNHRLMTRDELKASLDGFNIDRRHTLLVTYHPATRDNAPVEIRINALFDALDRFGGYNVLFTYANNDAGGSTVNRMVENYVAQHPGRTKAVPSLGMKRYLSALRNVAAVVGNSSSGIVEVPSMHIPTVDIGIRQAGRTAAPSVIHCGDSADDIAAAIAKALSAPMRRRAARCANPYFREDTLGLMTDAIMQLPSVLNHRSFYDSNK